MQSSDLSNLGVYLYVSGTSREEVDCLMEEFEQAHSDNRSFMLWLTYMSMVEILLDFIKAERIDN